MKSIVAIAVFLSVLVLIPRAADAKVWNPAQYYLTWNMEKDSTYYLHLRSTAINDTNNHTDWSQWSRPYLKEGTNVIHVLQGTGNAHTQFYVVASNLSQVRTSNIVGWPTNLMNTPATGDVKLFLVKMPLGPPMYFVQPNPPSNLRVQ